MDDVKKVYNNSCNDGLLLRMGLNDNKAGMQGLDKEKINKIIMEATKGSKFYENELKKDQQVNQRIEKMMQLKEKITAQQLLKAQMQVDKLVIELEQNRNLSSTIVHIDMDAFYAAVEMRDNPELKEKPIAVGSMSMLSTSNYHARRFGVRAAMPGFIAKRLCPHLTIVPLNFEKYGKVSKEVREILAEYDPNFMPMGLDEAYLNITEHLEERLNWPEDRRRFFFNTESTKGTDKDCMNMTAKFNKDVVSSSPVLFEDNTSLIDDEHEQRGLSVENSVVFGTSAEEVVKEIRFRIEQKTQLTASAGIAPNTMLAKMCTDHNKPNGQYRISPERLAVLDFLKDLPIRKVPGIGKVTEKMLKALGIVTCSELYQQRALLSLLFSEVSWHNFLYISLGLGSTHLEKDGERKSMSTERTFSEINTAEDQYSLCRELCRDLAQELQKEGLKGKTVTLKLKNVNFKVKTRASTVLSSVSTEEEIFTVAKDLLGTEIDSVAPHPLRIRLMGVRVSGFLTEEEKKYQQKSITSFLKPGKEIDFLSLQPEKSNQEYFTKNSEAPHRESFFDQKRAARQLNSKQLFHDDRSSANFVDETKKVADLPNSNVCEIFTCPVCFEKQSSNNLEELHRHIDECLNETCVKDSLEISKNDSSRENTSNFVPQFKNEWVDKCQKNETDQLSGTGQSASVSDSSTDNSTEKLAQIIPDKSPREQQPSNLSDIARNVCVKQRLFPKRISQDNEDHFDKTEDTEGSSSSCFFETKEDSVLVCPVCNLEQKTTSLMSFNRHVDVCLNKGLIQELTEKQDFPTKTYNMENSNRVFSGGLSKGQQRTNPSQGTKRSGLTASQSISKKAKSSNSKHTIKMFFK
ncbi:DNA polymerase kappa isoform X1 [Motacilla alba alba]|uniref:DNA polymerase kappa isoform X1 n=2 Tax=Motacilla alba alba TaxID=1094192 RepID=UPI0018D573EF|nr:DNA polymerase kappa isoform X1 [Motacilla alba alba]XP_037980301.1 DNA polymerase kappa isoform X1 [Motacilla alba alba]XP_037980302.1 DNA polymerase kappa isoform X1 [Motacilla alba alba]XP_037980303.1 DNA polymerase kappa isoform X1 [Motacilla alba alba]XP_037980304.1 DNA polymerase kappa isoform X1 [Motacilla alba alba]XP_037980305.1 DNA polymerase kappa isoform X1 [Motacilla alba alba]XP_037980306.1 DNA polymerase kappa isoform X1 [Motacilla alba alba]XP_037980307.1 DNA polymerase ka